MARNHYMNITEVLNSISASEGIALSTLKANSRILRGLELIEFGDRAAVTKFGVEVLSVLAGRDVYKPLSV